MQAASIAALSLFAMAWSGTARAEPARPVKKAASVRLMGEILSNVAKTRAEISQTFARNSRG